MSDTTINNAHGDTVTSHIPGLQDFSVTLMPWEETATMCHTAVLVMPDGTQVIASHVTIRYAHEEVPCAHGMMRAWARLSHGDISWCVVADGCMIAYTAPITACAAKTMDGTTIMWPTWAGPIRMTRIDIDPVLHVKSDV